jgi:hypothetical protein
MSIASTNFASLVIAFQQAATSLPKVVQSKWNDIAKGIPLDGRDSRPTRLLTWPQQVKLNTDIRIQWPHPKEGDKKVTGNSHVTPICTDQGHLSGLNPLSSFATELTSDLRGHASAFTVLNPQYPCFMHKMNGGTEFK